MSTTTVSNDEIRPYGPGKFDTILDAHVYSLSMDGCDEERSYPDGGGWYGLLRGPLATELEPVASDSDDRLNTAERAALESNKAGAIIHEDSQGFVSVTLHATDEDLEYDWAGVRAEFATDED